MEQIIKNVNITDINTEGFGIGRSELFTKVLFIKNAINGDVVDVKITKEEKNYAFAEIVNTITESTFKVQPKCEHFELCGGCNLQHASYPLQLKIKEKRVKDALQKIAKIETNIAEIIAAPDEFYYRNKMDFEFSSYCWITNEEEDKDRRALGLHIKNRFDRVLNIKNCHLHHPKINEIRNFIKDFCMKEKAEFYNPKYKTGLMRSLIFRTNLKGDLMTIIVFAKEPKVLQANLCMELKSNFPEITNLFWGINKKEQDNLKDIKLFAFKGEDSIFETLNNIKFKINAKSFFQINVKIAEEIIKKIMQNAGFTKESIVYDLYCGVGTFALNIAQVTNKVIGIEISKNAIADAKENAHINNISNVKFVSGDAGDIFSQDFILENGKADFIILDPPRAGISEKLRSQIIEVMPENIVYISCNPASFARDMMNLKNHYSIKQVVPFDMFPQTTHVEIVAFLTKN